MTSNEARDREDMNRKDGLDTFHRPSNFEPVQQVPSEARTVPTTGEDE